MQACLRGEDESDDESLSDGVDDSSPSSGGRSRSTSISAAAPPAISSSSKPPLPPTFKWSSVKRKRNSESPDSGPDSQSKRSPFITARSQANESMSTPIFMSQDDYNRFKSLSDIDIVSEIIRSSPELLQASILSMGNSITNQIKSALGQATTGHDIRAASPNSFNCAAALSLLCGTNAALFGASPIAPDKTSPGIAAHQGSGLLEKVSPLQRDRSISEASQNMDLTSDEDRSSGSPHSISTSSSSREPSGIF